MTMSKPTQSRRNFLARAGAAAAPFILPARVWAADPGPNSQINMAFIGLGPQGRQNMLNFLGAGAKLVAV